MFSQNTEKYWNKMEDWLEISKKRWFDEIKLMAMINIHEITRQV